MPQEVSFRRAPFPLPSAPPLALTLVAASYDDGDAVELTFDRAVDISAFDGSAITVDDPVDYDLIYHGTGGVSLLNPAKVRIVLVAFGNGEGGSITLTATVASGIVAVDDGGAWAGVSALALPFGV